MCLSIFDHARPFPHWHHETTIHVHQATCTSTWLKWSPVEHSCKPLHSHPVANHKGRLSSSVRLILGDPGPRTRKKIGRARVREVFQRCPLYTIKNSADTVLPAADPRFRTQSSTSPMTQLRPWSIRYAVYTKLVCKVSWAHAWSTCQSYCRCLSVNGIRNTSTGQIRCNHSSWSRLSIREHVLAFTPEATNPLVYRSRPHSGTSYPNQVTCRGLP